MTAKTFDADGIKINYCEGTYNMDAPGRPSVLPASARPRQTVSAPPVAPRPALS